MRPDVSIVVPVFNKEKYLRECLESILAQSHAAIEVLCVDDASTDGSRGVLKEFSVADSRLAILHNETNMGAAASRNAGIAAARGRYLRFVDADDVLPLNSTALLLTRAVEAGADLARGSIALFRNDRLSKPVVVHQVLDRAATTFLEEPGLWIPWWHTSYLISTDLIRNDRIAYPDLRRGEDPVFLSRCLTGASCISLLPQVTYFYRKYRKISGSGRPKFEELIDYVRHAAMVKAHYLSHHPLCWEEGYGPFIREDICRLIAGRRLDASREEALRREMQTIWSDLSSQEIRRRSPLGVGWLRRWLRS